MARLRILSLDEIKSLYQIPKLESDERQFVFELDEEDKDYINTIALIGLILSYFISLVIDLCQDLRILIKKPRKIW